MAYTTIAQVKNELTYNYDKAAAKKLTEDGYIDVAQRFDETSFLTFFVNQSASFIDSYLSGVATPPFAPNGVLDKINRNLAVYDAEMYLKSAQSDRQVSVSIYAMQKQAIELLQRIIDGDIALLPADGAAPDQGTVRLIEPDNDGVTLTVGDLEENILLGGCADATEIPE